MRSDATFPNGTINATQDTHDLLGGVRRAFDLDSETEDPTRGSIKSSSNTYHFLAEGVRAKASPSMGAKPYGEQIQYKFQYFVRRFEANYCH